MILGKMIKLEIFCDFEECGRITKKRCSKIVVTGGGCEWRLAVICFMLMTTAPEGLGMKC
jgi:hypothetical protein